MENVLSLKKAKEPEDLAKYFMVYANAGDVEGLVSLYESDAVLSVGNGKFAAGHEAIRLFYAELLSSKPVFTPGVQSPAIRKGNIALTSSRLDNGNFTAEIARQQSDGSWLWAVDQPAIGKIQ